MGAVVASKRATKPSITVKVYLVYQFSNVAESGKPNVALVGARLTRMAAQDIVNRNPGTYIEKCYASK